MEGSRSSSAPFNLKHPIQSDRKINSVGFRRSAGARFRRGRKAYITPQHYGQGHHRTAVDTRGRRVPARLHYSPQGRCFYVCSCYGDEGNDEVGFFGILYFLVWRGLG